MTSFRQLFEIQIRNRIQTIHDKMKESLSDFRKGQIIRSGLSVVLAGPVNAGKSTLLNFGRARSCDCISFTRHNAGQHRGRT